ncbi:unnamed protein product [Lactuca saligna]|uniref:Uncharacterized protein n=1 Tax=Lactuca saligna TaxID=75948 RepID=A0AA36DZB1_LACSI|nr:unnamed protein product [Lactuca saligna]
MLPTKYQIEEDDELCVWSSWCPTLQVFLKLSPNFMEDTLYQRNNLSVLINPPNFTYPFCYLTQKPQIATGGSKANSENPFIDPSKLENIVKGFASKQDPLPLSFGSIGSLPNDNNVLFLAPTPTLPLLQFHFQLCDAMKREGIEIGEEYRPDSWIPFCPVAEEVPKNRMAEAFTVLRDLKLPVTGYAMDIGLVEYSPVRELFSFVLGNSVES